jgi:PAS domain S-box-containing protein
MNGKATILIIDDKPANIFALEQLLERPERLFLDSTNGEDGLKIALANKVDLIILDVQMPVMDGFEVANILKSNKRTKDIPIIFASAEKKERNSIMKGFEEGAVDYLSKPLDPEITKAKVAVLLQIQLQKKELFEKNISLEKSALLINNSADIIGVIDPVTLKFEDVNNSFTAILGYPIEEVKEAVVTFFIHAEDRILVQNLVKDTKERFSVETRVYCKDRSIKWLLWHVVVRGGKWFINARDITEIKHIERIRSYLATTVKQSPDAIYIYNHEGNILSWNEGAERIYGYKEKEVLQRKIWNIIPEYLLPETQQILDFITEGKQIQFQQVKRISKERKALDLLFSGSVIIDSNDQQKSIAITERDVTQQMFDEEKIKQLNSQMQLHIAHLEESELKLASANRLKGEFVANMSHELRTPLNGIIGFSELLVDKRVGPLNAKQEEYLGDILNSGNHLLRLINDVLDLSKIESDKFELVIDTFSVNDTIDEVCSVVKSIADKKNITVAVSIASAIKEISIDKNKFKQVLYNLLSNAIKFTNPYGKVGIEVEPLGNDSFTMKVKDTGIGMSQEGMERLFAPFVQLDSGLSRKQDGTGLGLMLAKKFVERHNGKIWIESEPGKGSVITVILPRQIS